MRSHLAYARAVFCVAAGALYVRLYFGIDFSDESFYAALPYAFSLGHRPLIDELAVHQFAGILLVPFVKSYVAIAGGPPGLILFLRHLYFAAALGTSVVAARRLGPVFGRECAVLVSAVVLL
jgi:hypothetical protein